MAWTTPRTWVAGETVTASLMNTHVRDNLDYLKTQADNSILKTGPIYATATGTLNTGNNDNFALGSVGTIQFTTVGANSILTGLTNGSGGRRVRLINAASSGSFTLSASAGASTAANRFATDSAGISPGTSIDVEYVASATRWYLA